MDPDGYWLTGADVFDATGTASRRADVHVVGERIAAVEPVDPASRGVDRRAPTIDVTGGTLLPGFIDAHAHVGILRLHDQGRMAPAVQAGAVFANLRSALDQGFTTLRDLGGVDGGLVEAIERGLVAGPRLLPSGQILSQTGGHGDHRGRWSPDAENPPTGCGISLPMRLVDGPDAARRAAREQFHRGATQLKVFATGGVLSDGDPLDAPQFSLAELRAVVEVAEDRGSYVTAHAHTSRGLLRALDAGVRCIEHASDIDEAVAARIAECGASVVATLTVHEVMRAEPGWDAASARLHETTLASLAMLDRAGVRLGCGADLIGERQDRRAWEPFLHAELFGAAQALQTATRVNAEILGIDDLVGTVEPGKLADLVVLDGDPLRYPASLRDIPPRLVVQSGRVVRRSSSGPPVR
ncbi:amidohydrolase family protein [Actinoplanes sp. NPDC051851]|uniref:metal-dependent hydrolase family protein n=1 Tax=Actinoplanes sp. NPDC051851 TaxID=3154753 RepID=UPI0034218995